MTEDQTTVLILGIYGIILAIFLLSALLCLIANWRLFKRAGYKGWYSLIPFYAGFVKHKITFGEDNKWFYFIGWVIAIYYYYIHFCYVRAFGGSKGLAVFGLFFPGIATLIIAFGKAYTAEEYHPVPHLLN